jgi:rhodanese-related sulfurtransferase
MALLSSQTNKFDHAATLRALDRIDELRVKFACNLPYVEPVEAHALLEAGVAMLIDVRCAAERQFGGYVPQSVHVPWALDASFVPNRGFLKSLAKHAHSEDALLFLCRSGQRAELAAHAARCAGFFRSFIVQSGFDGDLNSAQQRGTLNGWRFHNLPWIEG